jgi:hypothetical protein
MFPTLYNNNMDNMGKAQQPQATTAQHNSMLRSRTPRAV